MPTFECFTAPEKLTVARKSGDRELSNFWYKIGAKLLEDMSGI